MEPPCFTHPYPRVTICKTRSISLALSAAASSTPETEPCLLSDQEQKTFAKRRETGKE
jgi:hypothetical protein